MTLQGSFLTAVKAHRSRDWTLPFTARLMPGTYADANDPFSALTGTVADQTLYGNWAWRSQNELQGSPGGMMSKADVVVTTDIAYSGVLVQDRTRMIIDGIECAVREVIPYHDSGELVVAGVKVGL